MPSSHGVDISGTDPMRSALAQWTVGAVTAQILWTRVFGAAAVVAARKQRCAALLRHARTHSPFYRHLWRDVPASAPQLADLPVVTKSALMSAFDTWSTDPAIRWPEVETFIGTRAHIGERFLDRYLIWTSTGTTGRPGVFIQDDAALAVYDALVTAQLLGSAFAHCDWGAAAAQSGRAALVTADGDHFASIASWRRVAHGKPWLDMKSFGVTRPVPELVTALNDYQPAFVSTYPTMLALLADEQQAGRLHLEARRPVGRRRSAVAFGARGDRGRIRMPVAQRVRRLRMPDDRPCLPRTRAARERRLGRPGTGRSRLPADAARRAVAHRAADQSRQFRAADHSLRPGRSGAHPYGGVRVRQRAAGDRRRGPVRRRRDVPRPRRNARAPHPARADHGDRRSGARVPVSDRPARAGLSPLATHRRRPPPCGHGGAARPARAARPECAPPRGCASSSPTSRDAIRATASCGR